MISFLSMLLFSFGFLFLFMFAYSLSKTRNSLSGTFALMCLAIAVYIIGYAFEMQASSLEEILFFLKMEYFGAPFMSAFWLLFAYKFKYKQAAPLKITLLALIFPILTTFFGATNEYHHWVYREVTAFVYEGSLLADLSKGPWYYVNIVYAYAIQIFGFTVFYSEWRKTAYQWRSRAFWMFIGSISPGLLNLIYMLGLSPLSLDLTPFGLVFSGVFFYFALFHYDFFDLKEIIKDITFRNIREGIIVIDEKGRLLDFNPAARNLFSWLDTGHIGTSLTSFSEGRQILNQQDGSFEMELDIGGTKRWFEFSKTEMREKSLSAGWVYVVQDTTDLRKLIQSLNEMASYDVLTQIYTRRRLLEEAQREMNIALRYGHPIAFLMLDIDHFKKVNDVHGHLGGDEVLKGVAALIRNRLRCTDILGRFGGEEFLVVLPETDRQQAILVAEDIRKLVSAAEFPYRDRLIKVTISIGVTAPDHLNPNYTLNQLIDLADQAMYMAKKKGRNQVCCSDQE